MKNAKWNRGDWNMNRKMKILLAVLCYLCGALAAVYIGGWIMLLKPLRLLVSSYQTGALGISVLLHCVIKIALSTTVGGLVWCIGYMGCNYFRGTEDEYDRLLAAEEEQRKKRAEQRRNELYNKESGVEA